MYKEKNIFKTKGKVPTPENFKKGTISKVNRRVTSNFLIESIFLSLTQVFVFIFKFTNSFFKPKVK